MFEPKKLHFWSERKVELERKFFFGDQEVIFFTADVGFAVLTTQKYLTYQRQFFLQMDKYH